MKPASVIPLPPPRDTPIFREGADVSWWWCLGQWRLGILARCDISRIPSRQGSSCSISMNHKQHTSRQLRTPFVSVSGGSMPTSLSVSVDCVDCSALSMIHSHPAPMHQSCTARQRILFIHLRLIILHQYPSVPLCISRQPANLTANVGYTCHLITTCHHHVV